MNWSQFRTIIWLRWRLSRNQWSRGGTFNAVLSIVMVVIGLGIGFIGGIVGLLLGIFALSKASPQVMLIVWDIIILLFLFLWILRGLSFLGAPCGRMRNAPQDTRVLY